MRRPVPDRSLLPGTALPGTALLGTALLGTALLGTALLGTALLGTALLGIGLAEVLARPGFTAWTVLGAAGMTVPVLFCRWFPLAAAVLCFGTLVVQEGFGGDVTRQGYAPVLAALVVSYAVGRGTTGRRSIVGGAILLGLTWASVPLGDATSFGEYVGSFAFTAIIALAPWLAGAAIRDRHDRMVALTALAAELAREREERIRVSIALERSDIARELHDVLAHSIGVMVVQAEAAEEVLARQPERAARSLRHIQRSGRDALTETRRVLSGLRGDAAGLDRVESLVAESRAAGLPTSLLVEGARRPLSPSADGAAYRIVQEALTNVRRHSDATSVSVSLRFRADDVEVEIADDGLPVATAPDGLGMTGMRERAARCGGTLWTGPGADRGFVVRARLPVDPVPT